MAVFGNEVEARWDAPVCHPEHCTSAGPQIHEAHPARSTVMVCEPWERFTPGSEIHSWEARGDFGSIGESVVPGSQCYPMARHTSNSALLL